MMQSSRRQFLIGGTAAGATIGPGTPAPRIASESLVQNGDFRQGGPGQMPAGWELICPNSALMPRFAWERRGNSNVLTAAGNGRPECLAWARQKIKLEGGKTFEFRVSLEADGLDDLNTNLVHGIFDSGYRFNHGIFEYSRDGNQIAGTSRFAGPVETTEAEVRLYFRFSPRGQVRWKQVTLQECEPITPRLVTIAYADGPVTGDYREVLARWDCWLDYAGQQKADVALLPEMFNGRKPREAEPLQGPSGELLRRKARQWRMYVCGSFYERRGDVTYNTAPLYDREGRLAGTYEKNYPFDPELDDGVTPGTAVPIFQTDFGRVGIQICYDNWFPEVVRLLAYQGADLILYPNAGYYPELMAARATDSGVWIAVSSLNLPAGIWDSGGARAGGELPGLCPATSIVSWKRIDRYRMLIGSIDMSVRYSPAWAGGPMRSAPGGRRLRRTRMNGLEPEIARASARWWRHPGA
jgi:predicted amidohydrolase